MDKIECSCEKGGIHLHVSWGNAPHEHWNSDLKVIVKRPCNRLHWYCMNVSCGCRR